MNAMTWAPVWEAVLAQLVVPVVVAAVGSLGAYLLTLLPGPLQRFLSSSTRQRDIELVVAAMTRKALERLMSGGGGSSLPALIADDVVAYVKTNLPEVIAKLAPSEDALRTMARSAMAEAMARLTPSSSAPPTSSNLRLG